METHHVALALLALRLLTVGFLAAVISKQLWLLRKTETDLTAVRIVLITLVGIAFIGNFMPIYIDLLAAMGEPVDHLIVPYAISNALIAVTSAAGWWMLYRVIAIEAERRKKLDEARSDVHKQLVAKNEKLTKDNKSLKKRR